MKVDFTHDQCRVTIFVDRKRGDSHDGYVIDPLDRQLDESHEKFAERVAKRLVELQARPGRIDQK